MRFNTALIHGQNAPDEKTGATNTPIYQSSAFAYHTAEELAGVFKGTKPGFVYSRINNPTVEAWEKRLAYLEGGMGAVACSSGMAAVSLAVMNILKSGEEILSGSGIFGGTHSLFKNLEDFGITTRYVEDSEISSFAAHLNEKTRLIYVETIGNPKLDVQDIEKLAALAHQHGIPLVVDNTATTPYIVKPIALGADIVVHSTSKYINGSGNSISGIIVDSGKFKWDYSRFTSLSGFKKFGPFAYLAKLRNGLFRDFGACLSPFNAFLNTLGLETLGLRMERLCQNAFLLATELQKNPKVLQVNYPGLEDHEQYFLTTRQFGGKGGAILTVRVGSKENAFTVINHLQYAANLANIGDVRTLVIHPASTICVNNTREEKESMGVYEDLIRISVGLEDIEDLREDFAQALSQI